MTIQTALIKYFAVYNLTVNQRFAQEMKAKKILFDEFIMPITLMIYLGEGELHIGLYKALFHRPLVKLLVIRERYLSSLHKLLDQSPPGHRSDLGLDDG